MLNHPRVLPVYDWGLDPQPYSVTEYLTGGSLSMLLSAGHLLTPSQALVVGLEAARALVNIHAGGRAHLGLGSSAILFDSGARPYISDLDCPQRSCWPSPATMTRQPMPMPTTRRTGDDAALDDDDDAPTGAGADDVSDGDDAAPPVPMPTTCRTVTMPLQPMTGTPRQMTTRHLPAPRRRLAPNR